MNIYYRKTGLLIAFFSCITIHNAYCSEKKSFIERAKPYYERAKPYYNSTKNWASQKKDTIVNTVKNNPRTTAGIVLGVGALTIAYKSRQRIKQWINKGTQKIKSLFKKVINWKLIPSKDFSTT